MPLTCGLSESSIHIRIVIATNTDKKKTFIWKIFFFLKNNSVTSWGAVYIKEKDARCIIPNSFTHSQSEYFYKQIINTYTLLRERFSQTKLSEQLETDDDVFQHNHQ